MGFAGTEIPYNMSRIKNSRFLRGDPKIVGTVHSPESLRSALRLREGDVDFLELRVDHFAGDPSSLLRVAPRLPAPLIVTVRHPSEGGACQVESKRRRQLFSVFLPVANCIDIELRSVAGFSDIIAEARAAGVGVIVSDHHFYRTPSARSLAARLRRAILASADVFKIAAFASSSSDVAVLLTLLAKPGPIPLSVMGMGRFGKVSRLLFAQAGSVLNYGYLDQPNASGQWEATLLKKRIAELAE
jgi:3-dehydroquinate dehydratase-1